MDTSDGVLSTLDQLMRLNNVGFEINAGWEDSLDRQSKNLALPFGIPLWLLLAGQHGEFELTFTVPANREHLLIETAEKNGWKPMRLGKVVDNPHIAIPMYNRIAEIDTGRVRNLAFQFDGGVEGYIEGLLTLDHEIQKGV
jgi:thiamine-monophosphate kinase